MVTTPCDGCATATVGKNTKMRAIANLMWQILFWLVCAHDVLSVKKDVAPALIVRCKRAAMGVDRCEPRKGAFLWCSAWQERYVRPIAVHP
jgi:hypothetical protein